MAGCCGQIKWRVYALTLVSYATIHSIRTMWSTVKNDLTLPPFNYSANFLGTIDMLALFTIALFINIIGPRVEIIGSKKCLQLCMVVLLVLNTLVAIFLNLDLTDQWLYVVFFGLGAGIFSSFGWPACLCMLSFYFTKKNGILLSAWNGTSQLGDFISLITYYAIVNTREVPQQSFFLISLYLFVLLILNAVLLPAHAPQEVTNEEPHLHEEKVEVKQEVKEVMKQEEKMKQNKQVLSDTDTASQADSANGIVTGEADTTTRTVNLLTVWLLPGIALNVLAYGVIKSINAFIVSWMVYYLFSLQLGSQAVLITILWSGSVFIGGLFCGFVNKKLTNSFFVIQLFLAAAAFIFIEEFHHNIYETQIIIGVILCGLCYGGPYSLMSTAIPIKLASQRSIADVTNARAAIISIMQGFGQFGCGISIILVPTFGIARIHIAGAIYCFVAAFLLLAQDCRLRKHEMHESVVESAKIKETASPAQ